MDFERKSPSLRQAHPAKGLTASRGSVPTWIPPTLTPPLNSSACAGAETRASAPIDSRPLLLRVRMDMAEDLADTRNAT
ncbi:hypothetical protein BE04_29890 [Sorangium cellulosum]|uniref:Uncharacterized protein n=1 Tax=Sorangium cellulosum TaxID=56 RepID=A0A150P946_SORCE|nr:hypothetical protein BE04_29890 [Sorangium cellulosum]